MKPLVASLAVVLLLVATAEAGWYVGPRVVYYPAAPVYVAPPPVVVAPAPVVVPPPPYAVYAPPVVAPAPVVVGPAAVVGPRGRVYYYGRPVRNAVRAVLPY